MPTLRTLENISTEEILDAFNLSFSDYIVPISLSKEKLEDKIVSESIKLEISVGAFEDNQLIAFILHGYDSIDQLKVVYNAGTGVIPAKRGNKLTSKLYEFALPILQKNSIDKVLLEVITTNETAIKIYKAIGFKMMREFDCYKGSLSSSNTNKNFEIRELNDYDWQKLQSLWDIKPSWQNSITAVEKLKNSNVSIGIYEGEKIVGYAIFNPKTKRIHQLSVDKNYRKMGVGQQLLAYIKTHFSKEIVITNIDTSSKITSNFMTINGLELFIKQYEMELGLK